MTSRRLPTNHYPPPTLWADEDDEQQQSYTLGRLGYNGSTRPRLNTGKRSRPRDFSSDQDGIGASTGLSSRHHAGRGTGGDDEQPIRIRAVHQSAWNPYTPALRICFYRKCTVSYGLSTLQAQERTRITNNTAYCPGLSPPLPQTTPIGVFRTWAQIPPWPGTEEDDEHGGASGSGHAVYGICTCGTYIHKYLQHSHQRLITSLTVQETLYPEPVDPRHRVLIRNS